MSELLVASWIETKTEHRISGLEATGAAHDILAVSKVGNDAAIEVKFIGTGDSEFTLLLDNDIFGGFGDMPNAADFLLARIYEAAKQLAGFSGSKIVAVVIDEFMAWPIFQAALRFDRVDWQDLKLRSQDTNLEWMTYPEGLRKSHPRMDVELGNVISSLNEVRIFVLVADETLREEVSASNAT